MGVAAPAQAHDTVVSSTPAADATLTELPAAFDIVTSEPLLDVGGQSGAFALQVLDAQGLYYGDGCLDIEGSTMTTAAALGAAGAYTVRWQFIASDGHTVSGEYPFTWSPSTPAAPSTGSATPPVCGAAAPSPSPSASEPGASESPAASAPTDEATPAPQSEPSAQSDSLPVVLGIGAAVIGIAVLVVAAVLLLGRKRSVEQSTPRR